MTCIVCLTNQVITGDIYCQRCLSVLSEEDKTAFEHTITAQAMHLAWAGIALKAAIRRELPKWLRWIVPN